MSSQPPGQYGTQGQFGQTTPAGSGGSQSPAGGFQQGMQGPEGGQMAQPGGQGYGADVGTTGFGQPGGQPGMGGTQQPAQQGMGPRQGGGLDLKLDEALTDPMRVALHDFTRAANACEWCAERCIDHGPEMAECVRLCRDVADLATLNVGFIARDSAFGPEVAEVFAAAADACARECARHAERHCQECAEVLSRAVQSTRSMLDSFQGGGQQGFQQQGTPIQQGIQSGQQGSSIQGETGGGIQSGQQQGPGRGGQF